MNLNMTVQTLIYIEKKYQSNHKDNPMMYNDVGELEPKNINDDTIILEKGYIAKHNYLKPEVRQVLAEAIIKRGDLVYPEFKMVRVLNNSINFLRER